MKRSLEDMESNKEGNKVVILPENLSRKSGKRVVRASENTVSSSIVSQEPIGHSERFSMSDVAAVQYVDDSLCMEDTSKRIPAHSAPPILAMSENSQTGEPGKTPLVDEVAAKKVHKPASSKMNLCLFFAVFNVLKPSEQNVVAKGNMGDPASAFLEFMHSGGRNSDRKCEGYRISDISNYLQHLLRSRLIKGYQWHRAKKPVTLNTLLNQRYPKDIRYVFSGWTTTGDRKVQLDRRTSLALKDERIKSTQKKTEEAVRLYHHVSDKFPDDLSHDATPHAFGVIMSKDGSHSIVDTSSRGPKELTMANFISSCIRYFGRPMVIDFELLDSVEH